MQTVSKKDLTSAELETMRISRSPTTMMTANGEVQTREEATEHVKELDLFVTGMLLEDTPAVLSLGSSVRIMGIPTTGPVAENHISPIWAIYKLCAIRSHQFIYEFLYNTHTYLLIIFITQDSVVDVKRNTENPVPERSGSTIEELRGDPLHKPTIISGSLGAMILSKTTPTCSLLFFEMMIFRISILSGTKFYCL